MDTHIDEYFSKHSEDGLRGNFSEVIPLHTSHSLSWKDVVKKVPKICKGWYELTSLEPGDRIEFIRDYWLSRLPYHPNSLAQLTQFFDQLDNICVFLLQKKLDEPYEARLVFSLKENRGFFHGSMGATEEEIGRLKQDFPSVIFPQDYLAFLQIHNGFYKATDTGILKSVLIKDCYNRIQLLMESEEPLIVQGKLVDPSTLIPFYESFGQPVFQCFWSDWYPEDEIGNVYYSAITNSLSDVDIELTSTQTLAFHTFFDWLFFYLERVAL